MNWIVPTETDLSAALSQREIDAFRASPGSGGADDPVTSVLRQAAGEVRAACRSSGRVRLDRESPHTVPRSLLRACVAIAAFDVLKRLPVPVGEDRRRAYEDALSLLRDVAAGRVTPESADAEDDTAASSPLPRSAEPHVPPRLLD